MLAITLRAGQLMIAHGANTARVEETMKHLAHALGIETLDVFVTPSALMATASAGGEHRTRIAQAGFSQNNLGRMAAVIEVSRQAQAGLLDATAVQNALEQIANQPRAYGLVVTILASSVGLACFPLLFGGGGWEFMATFLATAVTQWLNLRLQRIDLGRFITTWILAAATTGITLLMTALLAAPAPKLALTGSILLLIPGVLMVSSVSDLFRGDLLPGLARGAAAGLITAAIATGIWTVLLISGAAIAPELPRQADLLLALLLTPVITVGLAVSFNTPRQALPGCALTSMLAITAQRGVLGLGAPVEPALFCAGLVIGLMAALLARLMKLPNAIFAIPSFIPLVPGVLAFSTILAFFKADYTIGTEQLIRTAMLTGALAAGLGTINALVRIRQKSLF
jgi:uncharacterized membrane protein YjjP (DUF1212 family)